MSKLQATQAAPPSPEIARLQEREHAIWLKYQDRGVSAWEAFTAASAGLTDWQIEAALSIRQEHADSWWLEIMRTVQQMAEPPLEPPTWEQVLQQPIVQPGLLRRALSYYCLLSYIGNPDQQQKPIIGVLLLHPDQALLLLRYTLVYSAILPRSSHWRQISAYLDLLGTSACWGEQPVTPGQVRYEAHGRAADQPRWRRLVAFSPIYATLGNPETILDQLYKEHVMPAKETIEVDRITSTEVIVESDGRVETEAEESVILVARGQTVQPPALFRGRPSFAYLLTRMSARMTFEEVLLAFEALARDGISGERSVLTVALAHRAIRLVQDGLEAEQVDKLLLLLEREQATLASVPF